MSRFIVLSPPRVLELPEPCWYVEWPGALFLAILARLRGVTVVSLAIENLSVWEGLADARLRAPKQVARLMRWLWRLSTRVLTDIAFGTPEALANYQQALGKFPRSWSAPVLVEHLATCRCWTPADARSRILHVAEFSYRKGLDVIERAWETQPSPGWHLDLCGFGDGLAAVQAWAQGREDVTVHVAPDRHEVHRLLAAASVIVLASRRVVGWREQVGLPLLEGWAHGCSLICTSETGLAALVAAEGGVVLAPEDPGALAQALSLITAAGPAKVTRPEVRDSREEFERWALDRMSRR